MLRRRSHKRQSYRGAIVAAAFVCSATMAAPPSGVDAEREEARIDREFARADYADLYLAKVAERIVSAASERPVTQVRIRAVYASTPFIVSLGSGATYVSTGLLARLQDDSQLAALLAPELHGSLSPNSALEANAQRDQRSSAILRVLAVAASAGLAIIPLVEADRAADGELEPVVSENDRIGLIWAARAGFDVKQGPVATRRLIELLDAEHTSGFGRLGSRKRLERRTGQLERALEKLKVDAADPGLDSGELRAIADRATLELAKRQLSNQGENIAFEATLARYEREFGANSESICLRATYIGRQASSPDAYVEIASAYEACAASSAPSAESLRARAFFYRDHGDRTSAIHAFEDYLARWPDAIDAPIVKEYIEALRH